MDPERWRDAMRVTLTTLAHDARQALSVDQYEEALQGAERWAMTLLHQVVQEAGPVPDPQPRQGSWDYHEAWGGHYRLLDGAGHLVAYVVRAPAGEWKAVFQPGMGPRVSLPRTEADDHP